MGRPSDGRRQSPRHGSPFSAAAPSIIVAVGYAVATIVWFAWGPNLPGGRWFAVHLFTLGVLTNLVLTFSEHFARTLTRTPGERPGWWPLVTNLGVLGVVIGLPTGQRWLLTAGATVVTWSVAAAWWRIRRSRRGALGTRFGWVVRMYERAHGAFIHGALLGVALGIGLLPGGWYSAGRLAHLHANILGWGGLTLLATLVFFGPSMVRARIVPGADRRAARGLPYAATSLTVALLLLLASGVGDQAGRWLLLAAGLALAVYAAVAVAVCVPVFVAARGARSGAARWLVVGVCCWFPVLAFADAVVVATASWRWLDALGVGLMVGVLGQAIFATLLYLAPMLRAGAGKRRESVLRRVDRVAGLRALLFNAAAVLVVIGAARIVPGSVGMLGLAIMAVLVASAVVAVMWPPKASADLAVN